MTVSVLLLRCGLTSARLLLLLSAITMTLAATLAAASAAVAAEFPLSQSRPSAANCSWVFVTQPLSHSARGHSSGSYQQRLCVYDGYWQPQQGLPIFLYTGNESPVEEYVNNTGLMWTLAEQFQALVIFAEHRYFGESVPDIRGMSDCVSYLSADEALADYAALVNRVRRLSAAGVRQWWDGRWEQRQQQQNLPSTATAAAAFAAAVDGNRDGEESAVIAFGGSYGGMLASWMRIMFPSAVDGAIAASAPIWGFPLDSCPLDSSAQVVTYATSAAAGAAPRCADNLKAAYVLISDIGSDSSSSGGGISGSAGRAVLSDALQLCTPLADGSDVKTLLDYLQTPLFDLAEGSYPFPSDYITFALTDSTAPLPPWPLQVMCEGLKDDFGVDISGDTAAVRFEVTAVATSTAAATVTRKAAAGKAIEEEAAVLVKVDWAETSNNGYSLVALQSTQALQLAAAAARSIQVWYNVSGQLPDCIDWAQGAAPNSDVTTTANTATSTAAATKVFTGQKHSLSRAARRSRSSGSLRQSTATATTTTATTTASGGGDSRKFKNYIDDDFEEDVCLWNSEDFDSGTAWNVLVCNEGVNLVNWWAQGVGSDLYWPPNQSPNYSLQSLIGDSLDYCDYYSSVGLKGLPKETDNWAQWLDTAYGGTRLQYATNIVFSNGNLDPWSPAGAGVLQQQQQQQQQQQHQQTSQKQQEQRSKWQQRWQQLQLDESVVTAVIDMGAHHLDLFWPTADDPQSVRDVRALEAQHIAKWIAQKKTRARK